MRRLLPQFDRGLATLLKDLAIHLADIHGQHDQQQLFLEHQRISEETRMKMIADLLKNENDNHTRVLVAEMAATKQALSDDMSRQQQAITALDENGNPMEIKGVKFETFIFDAIPLAREPLFFETSRGCWWGQIHHCLFCGLNGDTIAYRSKSPGRAVEELRGAGTTMFKG